jgi:hypothetical protein
MGVAAIARRAAHCNPELRPATRRRRGNASPIAAPADTPIELGGAAAIVMGTPIPVSKGAQPARPPAKDTAMTRPLVARSAAVVLGALALAGTISLALAQQAGGGDRNGQSRLSDLMQAAQAGHIKLWFAGKARNWELAGYETRQVKTRLQDAASLYQSLPVNDVTTMAKPLDAVAAAIAAKDAGKFAAAYADLTAGCNSCHQSVKLGFIKMQTPAGNPFGNQAFGASKK